MGYCEIGCIFVVMETSNREGIWGIYWIVEGLSVVHRDMLGDEEPLVMYVDYKIKKRVSVIEGGEKRFKNMVVGIKCHWWEERDGERHYRYGRFNVHELIPKEVYDLGLEVVERWLHRNEGRK